MPDHTTVIVDKLPQCDLCFAEKHIKGVPALYDGKTDFGPWAYMCEEHFLLHGVGLGLGCGQRLILSDHAPVDE